MVSIKNHNKTDKEAFYKKSIKNTVKEIYNARGRPLQRSAKLNNDMMIDVPEEFIQYMQTGDSIIKESNSNQIILITFQQNSHYTSVKTGIQKIIFRSND